MTKATFTAADYAVNVAALIKAGNAIDKATVNAAATLATWAVASAVGIKANALTLDTIKAQLIAATSTATRKANIKAIGRDVSLDSLEACGSTVKGWFYSFQRIAKADALDRLIAGEAFSTVARGTSTVQKQARPNKAGDKGRSSKDVTPETTANDTNKIPVPSVEVGELSAAIRSVTGRIAAAKAATLMNSTNAAALADLIAVIGKATAMVEAAKAAQATKKAPRAKKAA